jgi:hypothetical protein
MPPSLPKLHRGLERLCQGHVARCRQAGVWSEPRWFRVACWLEAKLRRRPNRLGIGLLLAVPALVASAVLVAILVRGAGQATGDEKDGAHSLAGSGSVLDDPDTGRTSFAELTGSRFDPAPINDVLPPTLIRVRIPLFAGQYAIWGATGRDSRGHIWVGVSASGVEIPSAHLMEYLPEIDQVIDRGDAVGALKRAGLYRQGEGQMKIPSKIVQAADGYLYFASMDEQGESTDGGRLPTWGSHLWRIRPEGGDWEHLLSAPEGLIAVSCVGRRVYALGYFDHVLYQYDCATGKVLSTHVGAAGGHISHNFLSDERGHVYVPRLRAAAGDPDRLTTTLVEYDDQLHELAETPIRHYTQTRFDDSHGLLGILYLADRSMVFATDQGYLYRITRLPGGPALVEPLGWFHPDGESSVGSLFTDDGKSHLLGLSRKGPNNPNRYEWLVFDLSTRTSRAVPLQTPRIDGQAPREVLLYGSITRDNAGRFYLGGTYDGSENRSLPILFQARPPT